MEYDTVVKMNKVQLYALSCKGLQNILGKKKSKAQHIQTAWYFYMNTDNQDKTSKKRVTALMAVAVQWQNTNIIPQRK